MATWHVLMKEWFSAQHPAVKVLLVVGGGGLALGFGVLAAPAVGAMASAAGLGAAAGTLSGAAASSAGLAALGGGSLAAGGLGMAGGTAVVAATAAVAGTSSAAYLAHTISAEGAASRAAADRAGKTKIDDDDISEEVPS